VRPLYKNSTSRTIRSFQRFASGKGGLLTHGDVADPYHSCRSPSNTFSAVTCVKTDGGSKVLVTTEPLTVVVAVVITPS
jgi:hypothetical protein